MATFRYRVCPVAYCAPDSHPIVAATFDAYARLKRIGKIGVDSDKLEQAVVTVMDELDTLAGMQQDRARDRRGKK